MYDNLLNLLCEDLVPPPAHPAPVVCVEARGTAGTLAPAAFTATARLACDGDECVCTLQSQHLYR